MKGRNGCENHRNNSSPISTLPEFIIQDPAYLEGRAPVSQNGDLLAFAFSITASSTARFRGMTMAHTSLSFATPRMLICLWTVIQTAFVTDICDHVRQEIGCIARCICPVQVDVPRQFSKLSLLIRSPTVMVSSLAVIPPRWHRSAFIPNRLVQSHVLPHPSHPFSHFSTWQEAIFSRDRVFPLPAFLPCPGVL